MDQEDPRGEGVGVRKLLAPAIQPRSGSKVFMNLR